MEKIANFRDYGVYKTTDGQRVKAGRLFRSANLSAASSEDMKSLLALGIGTIMDLREDLEVSSRPDQRIEGIAYLQVPASSLGMKEVKHESTDPNHKHFNKDKMLQIYRELPFGNKAYATLFALLRDSEKGILHHCSAGKDRAGVAAALILLMLGVGHHDVMEDYLKSNDNMKDIVATLTGSSDEETYQRIMEVASDAFFVNADYLNAALDAILEKYPDFESFFAAEYGITAIILSEIREKYLEV